MQATASLVVAESDWRAKAKPISVGSSYPAKASLNHEARIGHVHSMCCGHWRLAF